MNINYNIKQQISSIKDNGSYKSIQINYLSKYLSKSLQSLDTDGASQRPRRVDADDCLGGHQKAPVVLTVLGQVDE